MPKRRTKIPPIPTHLTFEELQAAGIPSRVYHSNELRWRWPDGTLSEEHAPGAVLVYPVQPREEVTP